MAGTLPATGDEVRTRFAGLFGDTPEDLVSVPIADLRALLAAVDEQLDEYVALGFYTPAEADVLRLGAHVAGPTLAHDRGGGDVSQSMSQTEAERQALDARLRQLVPGWGPAGPEVSTAELRRMMERIEAARRSPARGLHARWAADGEDYGELIRRGIA